MMLNEKIYQEKYFEYPPVKLLIDNVGTSKQPLLFFDDEETLGFWYDLSRAQVFIANSSGDKKYVINYNGSAFSGSMKEAKQFISAPAPLTLVLKPQSEIYFSDMNAGKLSPDFSPCANGQFVTLFNISISLSSDPTCAYFFDCNNVRLKGQNGVFIEGFSLPT